MFDVITIGSVSVDNFIKSDFLKTVTDPEHLKKIGFRTGKAQCFSFGSKIEIEEPIVTIGGGAYNAGVEFSRCGFSVGTLFNIGNDQGGEMILDSLKKEKIKPIFIMDKNKQTGKSFILLSKSGERTILVFRGCSGKIEKKDIPFSKLKTKWAYIVSGDMSLETLLFLFEFLKKNKISIALAPSKGLIELGFEKIKPLINMSRVVMLNREEASYLTNVSYSDKEQIFSKLDKEVDGIVVMTDGSRGSYISDGQTIFSARNYKEKELVDRTGAGDAFGSGFVAGLIIRKDFSRESIAYAIKLANANATSVIEKVGSAVNAVTKKEFENEVRWKNLEIKMKKISKK